MSLCRTATGCALALSVLAGVGAEPGHLRSIVRAQATQRQLFVSVFDEDGALVRDLRADEFIILEDGILREVLSASRATEPMQLALLVDTSDAARPVMTDFRLALEAFVEELHEANEIAVITFGGARMVVVEATRDLGRLKSGISRLFARPETATYLLEALFDTAGGFIRREARRPVMIVLTTNGVDLSSERYQDVATRLRESGAPVYAVLLPTVTVRMTHQDARGNPVFPSLPSVERDAILELGPKVTGGRQINIVSSTGSTAVLKQIAAELSNQYQVIYAAPEMLLPPRQIQVGVRRPNLTVRSTTIAR